jgi:hypothetical protein
MGVWHYILTPMMASLQDYAVARDRLFVESCIQTLVFPPIWFVVHKLRAMRTTDAQAL